MRNISYIKDFEAWRESFSFSIPIKVRFSETDMFGHMNNVSPFIYFEQARIEYMKDRGFFTELMDQGSVPVVADLQCDYHAQVFFDETIQLFVKTETIGTSSIDVHYLGLKENGKVCLTGRGSLVNIDRKNGTPIPLTPEQKDKFQEI